LTVSDYSKIDIEERYNIYPDKIDVTYNGSHDAYRPLSWDEREAVKAEYTDGTEYFVFAGALHPRKNVVALLQAFIKFKKRHRSPIKLVIVGRMAWKFKELAALRETMPFKKDVVWAGYMNVKELSKVIGAAYALIYPSLFEGFGIPILESLKCGVPAVVSNTSSMPEVAGDAALLVDPADVTDIAEKMGLIYKDEILRNKLVAAAGPQAAKFDWDASAARLWESMMKCTRISKI
jgi:glycosyltransferase involved in cell wall biosynthesis